MTDTAKIHRELNEIHNIAVEIEKVQNFPQDIWTMKEIDKKARRIQELCLSIASQIGTGDGGRSGTGCGY